MRDIKFRAWDKKRKVMIGSDYPENWGDDKDEWYADVHFMDLVAIEGISANKEFEVMQYTGLKDKNGVEIYEGDIVRAYTTISEVAYGDGSYESYYGYRGVILKDKEGSNTDTDAAAEWEVIGNIHENPELLKTEE